MRMKKLSMVFQLTASQGGWRFSQAITVFLDYFNSQPHKEADNLMNLDFPLSQEFQLTASQGGWLVMWTQKRTRKPISTHSLTRRLTLLYLLPFLSVIISTHSLTRRLTPFVILTKKINCISTHSLTRRLTTHGFPLDSHLCISTHSLTRRLTQ